MGPAAEGLVAGRGAEGEGCGGFDGRGVVDSGGRSSISEHFSVFSLQNTNNNLQKKHREQQTHKMSGLEEDGNGKTVAAAQLN